MVILFLIFWGTAILFSILAVSFYIHTSNAQVFQFLHILINTCHFSGWGSLVGSHRVRHDWSNLAAAALFCLFIYFNDLIFSFGCTGSLLLFNSYSLVVVHRLLLLQRMGSKVCGLQQLWPMGLVALRQLGPSQTREWTCVPWIGRLIPNHWTTYPSSWVWSDISLCFGVFFF